MNDEWVKCSDRLPPPYRVLVTVSDSKKWLVTIGNYHAEFGWEVDDCELDDFGLGEEATVTAWMDFPKPWGVV